MLRGCAVVMLVAVAATAACSTSSTGAGAAGDGGADAGDAPDAMRPFDDPECTSLGGQALSSISTAAAQAAAADTSCTTDADCVWVPYSCNCCAGCAGSSVVRADHMAPVTAAVDAANATTCATWASMGCRPVGPHPGCMEKGPWVACMSGACAFALPAAWNWFSLEDNANGGALPSQCKTGQACTARTVKPDGSISVVNPTHTATLSAADFAIVDGIMRSESFRKLEAGSCSNTGKSPPVWYDESRPSALSPSGSSRGFGVTGCVATAGSDFARLYAVVTSY
jgi:hypothetical protein